MHRVRVFIVAALLLPVAAAAQNQPRRIVIRASTVLDGKGGILRDVGPRHRGDEYCPDRLESPPKPHTTCGG